MIGLSGGGDSVALTSALLALHKRMGLKLAAAHLNHRLRGDESDRDEEFVRAMCARLGLELQVERAEGSARFPAPISRSGRATPGANFWGARPIESGRILLRWDTIAMTRPKQS